MGICYRDDFAFVASLREDGVPCFHPPQGAGAGRREGGQGCPPTSLGVPRTEFAG